ncbi:prenyltransferase [Halalkalirubrum salinum]|uniref:prenyltransferase n=1 Tax=Halalkalirubrum salinum TaxID=2563889 RepID=UPI0010FAFA70|nr:prenyltransferase [Halalkalirubrum salinum]
MENVETGAGRTDRSMRDRLWYLLTLSRPRFWLYLAGPIVVAVAAAASTPEELFLPDAVLLFGYFLFPANVLLYGVNDLYDREIDEENPKKDDKEARWQGDRLVLVTVIASGLAGVLLFAVIPPLAWPWLVGFFLLAIGYSAPPRFKTIPIADSVSNGLYILPGAAAYAIVAGTQPPVLAVAGAWLWTMGMHTFSAIPDIEPDRRAGIQTTATWLGERRTYAYVAACWITAATAFFVVDSRLGALMAVYPVFVAGVVKSNISVSRAYWWFPALNTVVGTLVTLGALWQIVPIWVVLP